MEQAVIAKRNGTCPLCHALIWKDVDRILPVGQSEWAHASCVEEQGVAVRERESIPKPEWWDN